MRIFSSLFIFLLIFGILGIDPGQVRAQATQKIPDLPLSEGPGFLLPDSPFYFLDLWRDNLNLLLASFTPETKARLHLKIAAERIMEIKLMLASKNVRPPGLDTALANITQNIEGTKQVLKGERSKGKVVGKLASELDQTLDRQQQALRILRDASEEKVRLKIKALEREIEDTEGEIENELPPDELEKELEEELRVKVGEEIERASESAQKVEHLLKKLREEVSKSAQKSQEKALEETHRAAKETIRAVEELKKSEEKTVEIHQKPRESSPSSKNE